MKKYTTLYNQDTIPTIRGGGRNSLTKKHSWDMIKQINVSDESNGCQPYQQNRVYDTDGIVPALPAQMSSGTHAIMVKSATKEGFETAKEGDSINLSMLNSKTRRGRVGVGVAQTLDTQANQSVVVKAITETRTEESKQIRKESMKNGKDFSPRRGKELKLREDDNANTVTSNQGIEQTIFINSSIRRLTEIEVERLQGFPDNWTKFGNYDGVIKEISRTQRYKLCGNAVTRDIVILIGKKLKENF